MNCKTLIPIWLPTLIVLAAILWLTLAPHPVGETDIPLFPGADKLVHAIMFFALSLTLFFDTARVSRKGSAGTRTVLTEACGAALLGVLIEFLQEMMGMGRSFDIKDMLADSAGATVAAVGWIMFHRQHTIDYTQFRRETNGRQRHK